MNTQSCTESLEENVTLANVLNSRPLTVSFRRALLGNKLTQWLQLVSKVADVALNNEKDAFVWSPNNDVLFIVKSMYSNMMTSEATLAILENKSSTKNQNLSLVFKERGCTKDNLIKRNWKGSAKFCLCNSNETIQHLFFECHMAKFIWFTVFISFNIKPPCWVLGSKHFIILLETKFRLELPLFAGRYGWVGKK